MVQYINMMKVDSAGKMFSFLKRESKFTTISWDIFEQDKVNFVSRANISLHMNTFPRKEPFSLPTFLNHERQTLEIN